ncbi:hypothetical protein [Emticicia sp. C21]|uniref:hypothetical protein n=1 Tax=Emticicia sp. C21 TaxID=2302915 RepID=UPI000E346426|nr:hypothetical protein [Emticicia sp. C21]RFS17907.1 hypothetical protein D0T08_01280 [Emticicia sp. C21]
MQHTEQSIKIRIFVLIIYVLMGCYWYLDNFSSMGPGPFGVSDILFQWNIVDFDTFYIIRRWEYGLMSSTLLLIALLVGKKYLKWILQFESIFTLLRYLFTKVIDINSYAGMAVVEDVVIYDFVGFLMRYLLVLMAFGFYKSYKPYKLIAVIIGVISTITLKILFFRFDY